MHIKASVGQYMQLLKCAAVVQESLCLIQSLVLLGRGKDIALDIASGIHYLHCNNVVHLDIKASAKVTIPACCHQVLDDVLDVSIVKSIDIIPLAKMAGLVHGGNASRPNLCKCQDIAYWQMAFRGGVPLNEQGLMHELTQHLASRAQISCSAKGTLQRMQM